ncbi:MAG: hypothetical protein ABFD82_17545 [Syntrophaceae bacterium]
MVIMYFSSQGEPENKLLEIIGTVVPYEDIRFYRTLDALSRGLRQPRTDLDVAVLMVSNRMELHDLIALRSLLWDIKIILILPDSDPDTIAEGHILRPRFLIDYQSNFHDVAAVLIRMIGNRGADNADLKLSKMKKSMKRPVHQGLQSQTSHRE